MNFLRNNLRTLWTGSLRPFGDPSALRVIVLFFACSVCFVVQAATETAALQSQIDACLPGGTVRIAPGVHVTGALFLKSDMTLFLEKGAVLKGSSDLADYPVFPYRWEGHVTNCYASLLNTPTNVICSSGRASGPSRAALSGQCEGPYLAPISNLTITGTGAIDASGDSLRAREKSSPFPRGRAVCLRNVTNLRLSGVTIGHSPAWCLHLCFCRDVAIDGIRIDQPTGVNGDGIDVESCSNVRISNSRIVSTDDSIAIKSGRDTEGRRINRPSSDILIEDCSFERGLGVAIGSEMSGGVSNVLVRNCTFTDTKSLASVKACRGRGAVVENICYTNCTHTNSVTKRRKDGIWFRGAINVDLHYAGPIDFSPRPFDETTPVFRNIVFTDLKTSTANGRAIFLAGLPESVLHGITFRNVVATGETGLSAAYVDGLVLSNVTVTATHDGPALFLSPTVTNLITNEVLHHEHQ